MVLLAPNDLVVSISVQCKKMKQSNAIQDRYDDDDDVWMMMMTPPPPSSSATLGPKVTFSKATHLERKRDKLKLNHTIPYLGGNCVKQRRATIIF